MKANHLLLRALILSISFIVTDAQALPLSPHEEPKADSFYICYEKRCPNQVKTTPFLSHTTYKYIGCVISRVPCHLHCGDKFNKRPTPLKQFQWVSNYPDALNSFYRCAYS